MVCLALKKARLGGPPVQCKLFLRDLLEAEKGRPIIILHKPTQENNETNTFIPNTPATPEAASLPPEPEKPERDDHRSCPKPTIFFNDGIRSVDFVLVWDAFDEEAVTEGAFQKRKKFEANLVNEGLELEYEPQEKNGLNFIKVISIAWAGANAI